MRPIEFSCAAMLSSSPAKIADQILDVANWSDFGGYAFLPGIKLAEFALRTPEKVGSRIRVTNNDGSRHIEEIVDWRAGRGLTLHLQEFSRPLSHLARYFEETWEFEPGDDGTKVVRSFKLYARSRLTWPLLWVISIFLKRAIDRHLAQMRSQEGD